jgi:hypothetical protein
VQLLLWVVTCTASPSSSRPAACSQTPELTTRQPKSVLGRGHDHDRPRDACRAVCRATGGWRPTRTRTPQSVPARGF